MEVHDSDTHGFVRARQPWLGTTPITNGPSTVYVRRMASAAFARTTSRNPHASVPALRIVAGLGALALVAGFGATTATAAGAGSTNHSRSAGQSSQDVAQIVAVAGSSRFLAYIQYPTVDGKPAKTGQLYERTSQGTRRKLGTVPTYSGNDPLLENLYSIAGRYLALGTVNGAKVRVWNLNTGQEYDRTTPQRVSEIAAAPDGYLVVTSAKRRTGYQKLETVSLSGTVRSLPDPYPPGSSYGVTVNASRYVAFRDGGVSRPWGAKTATFAHPGHITTLIGNRGVTSTPTTVCGVPSAHFVACDTESNGYRLQTYNLDGRLIAHTGAYESDYSPAPVAVANSTFWLTMAPNSQLEELARSGEVTGSTRTFADDGPMLAFHKIVVDSLDQTALLEVKSATSKPTVLVTAEDG
jgi:hypothetical protein